MRTRDEQIAELARLCEDAGILAPGAARGRAEDIMNEAEQRVQVEIERDSERLDWLADQQCQFVNMGLGDQPLRIINDCMGDEMASSYDLREAIDAARNGGE